MHLKEVGLTRIAKYVCIVCVVCVCVCACVRACVYVCIHSLLFISSAEIRMYDQCVSQIWCVF